MMVRFHSIDHLIRTYLSTLGDGRNVSGSRAGEVQKLATPSMSPLPPPRDTMSWPTPDNAQGEERKKVHERGEKSEKEKTPAKPHGKEKWVPVPFVPTPVFNTPLPLGRRGGGRGPRGSRDGSGGRGGHIPHGSISGTTATEKPSTSGSGGAVVNPLAGVDRSRREMGPPPRPGQSIQKPKRAVSAGPPAVREQQRKATDPLLHERNGESLVNEPRQTQDNQTASTESRRASTATQTETPQHTQQPSPVGSRNDNYGPRRQFQSQNDRDNGSQISSADHAHPRSGPERRTEGSMRAPENSRDYNGIPHTRDRGDGRPERGRGGFRGRGGYNGFGSTHTTNGQTIQGGQSNQPASSSFSSSKSQSFNERHASQPQVAPFVPRERGHRSNSRSQSIPNATGFGRFTNGGPPQAAQHLPALQTDLANMYGYQPGHPAIMSAMPYQPYIEQMQLIGMVQIQM
jgi:la-related protein 1